MYQINGITHNSTETIKFHPRLKKWVKVKKYVRNGLKNRVDNMNPLTEGLNISSNTGHINSIRIPSKKHKNRFKNFIKLFDNQIKKGFIKIE